MPAAKFVGRIWGPVPEGAEVEVPVASGGAESWVPFDRYPGYELIQFGKTDSW